MTVSTSTNLDYLFQFVRLKIGDTDPTAYRYTDDWIRTALVSAVMTLSKWWNNKYLLDDEFNIYRNPNGYFIFNEDEYGIIEPQDENSIVLMASYIILEGSLENSAWDYVSWRDAEIAYSNLESSRARNEALRRLWKEIELTLTPPRKRLARTQKRSLPGFKDNQYEVEGPY